MYPEDKVVGELWGPSCAVLVKGESGSYPELAVLAHIERFSLLRKGFSMSRNEPSTIAKMILV